MTSNEEEQQREAARKQRADYLASTLYIREHATEEQRRRMQWIKWKKNDE